MLTRCTGKGSLPKKKPDMPTRNEKPFKFQRNIAGIE
jgi:hypothetical protein